MIFFNISGFYKDVFVNSFFPCTAKLRNSLPAECFSLTYDLNGFNCRVDNHLPYAFHLCFPVFFSATLCLVLAVQPFWNESQFQLISISIETKVSRGPIF